MRINNSIFGKLDDLFLFCSIVEKGSLSKAADSLNLPISTISRRMNALEKTMGFRLLHPLKRELIPTQEGLELYKACFANLWQVDSTVTEFLADQHQLKGKVRLTVPRAFYYDVVRKTLRKLMDEFPLLQFEVKTNQLPTEAMLDYDTDIIMAFDLNSFENYVAKPIYRTKLGIFAHEDYFKTHEMPDSVEKLKNCSWIVNYDVKEVMLYKEEKPQLSFNITPRLVVNDILAAADEIRAGYGIGLLPLAKAKKHSSLVRIFPEYNGKIRQAYLIYRKTNFTSRPIEITVQRLEKEAKLWFEKCDDWQAEKQ